MAPNFRGGWWGDPLLEVLINRCGWRSYNAAHFYWIGRWFRPLLKIGLLLQMFFVVVNTYQKLLIMIARMNLQCQTFLLRESTLLHLNSLISCLMQCHVHYVKTSNRSRIICNGPLTPVRCTDICNDCRLAPVTHKRGRPTPGFDTTTTVTNEDFR
jgi:hypothetical protein